MTDKKYLDAYETVGLPLGEGKYTHHCVTPVQLRTLALYVDPATDSYRPPESNLLIKEYCDAATMGPSIIFAQIFTLIAILFYAKL